MSTRRGVIASAGVLILVLFLWAVRDGQVSERATGVDAAPVAQPESGQVPNASKASPPRNRTQASTAVDEPVVEWVGSDEDCEQVCGSACMADDAGALVCPPLCGTDEDCPDGTLCSLTRANGLGERYLRCLSSECENDDDCGPGRTCIFSGRLEGAVSRCEDAGERLAGEPCGYIGFASIGTCAVGLSCSSGMCVPRCASNADCPRGSACFSMAEGAGIAREKECVPSCTSDADCPEERRCVVLPYIGGAHCIDKTLPTTCVDIGCPEGEFCHIDFDVGWDFQASCAKRCSSEPSSCGPTEFCGPSDGLNQAVPNLSRCYKDCLNVPCPNGWKCVAFDSEHSKCSYDIAASTRRYFERFRSDAPAQ